MGRLFIPSYQSFACQRCGACCRGVFIPVSRAERETMERRLDRKGLFMERHGQIYLSRKEDGSCTLLDEENRCEIHARWGAGAKPLACRAFPRTFSLRGTQVAVGCRFDCPSVAQNAGESLLSDEKELQRLSQEIADRTAGLNPDLEEPWRGLDWEAFLGIVDGISETLRGRGEDLDSRAVSAIRLLEVCRIADLQALNDRRFSSRLSSLRQTFIDGEKRKAKIEIKLLSALDRAFFLQMLALCVRRDAERPADLRLSRRFGRAWAGTKVMLGRGSLSSLGQGLPAGDVSLLRGRLPRFDPGVAEPLQRFLRLKLDTHQFHGQAHHGVDLEEGFWTLMLCYPVVGALARLYASDRDATEVNREDVTRAIGAVERGLSQRGALLGRNARRTMRRLAGQHVYRKLCRVFGVH